MSGKSYSTPASVYEQSPGGYGAPPVASSRVVQGAPPAYGQATVVSSTPVSGQVIAVTPAPAFQQPMVVTVPKGMSGGQQLAVTDPTTGQQMTVAIPAGLSGGQQFQVAFPPPMAQAPPVAVQGMVVHQQMGTVSAATKRCRGCGVTFELDAKTNPASAAAFRCKKCRGFRFTDFF